MTQQRKVKLSNGKEKEQSIALVPSSVDFGLDLAAGSRVLGLEESLPDDLLISRIKLLQGVSDEVAQGSEDAGVFFDPRIGKSFEELLFVPVMFFHDRTNFIDRKMECASFDLQKGTSGRTCDHACPYFNWTQDKKDKRKSPNCSLNYNFLSGLVGKDAMPGIVAVSFSKSATGVGKQLVTTGTLRGLLWSHVYRLVPISKKFEKGTAWIPKISDARVTTGEERGAALVAYNYLREVRRGLRIAHDEDEVQTDSNGGEEDLGLDKAARDFKNKASRSGFEVE